MGRPISSNPGYDTLRYELCIVFPVDDRTGGFSTTGENVMKSILATGADTYSYFSSSRAYIFVLIRYPEEILTDFCDANDIICIRFDEEKLKAVCDIGFPEDRIKPLTIHDDPKICKYRPYEFIFDHFVSIFDFSGE